MTCGSTLLGAWGHHPISFQDGAAGDRAGRFIFSYPLRYHLDTHSRSAGNPVSVCRQRSGCLLGFRIVGAQRRFFPSIEVRSECIEAFVSKVQRRGT